LDTKLLPRLASGKKDESYFPIAVADNKFHCIILKGGDKYPYFPRPLLSEFEFSVPLLSAAPKQKQPKQKKQQDGEAGLGSDLEDDEESDKEDENDDDRGDAESQHLIQQFLLKGIQASQLQDLTEATSASYAQRTAISRLNVDIDKVLLQLLAVECREGEERGLRALEVVSLMRDRTGRMLGAAGKVAERYGRTILGEKIRELGEERVGRRESEDEDDF
jgi:chromosome transmission fidelity protein 4